MKDEAIDYSDIPELGDEFFEKAIFVPAKQLVSIRLDADVLAWLKRKRERLSDPRKQDSSKAVMESQEKPAKKRAAARMTLNQQS